MQGSVSSITSIIYISYNHLSISLQHIQICIGIFIDTYLPPFVYSRKHTHTHNAINILFRVTTVGRKGCTSLQQTDNLNKDKYPLSHSSHSADALPVQLRDNISQNSWSALSYQFDIVVQSIYWTDPMQHNYGNV